MKNPRALEVVLVVVALVVVGGCCCCCRRRGRQRGRGMEDTYVGSTGPISHDRVAVHWLQPEARLATLAGEHLELLRQTLALVQDDVV